MNESVRMLPRSSAHVAFSPDGTLLAVGAILTPIQLLDTSTWAVVRTFESLRHIHDTSDDSFGFEFSPDGARLAVGTLNEGVARVWDVLSGTLQQTLTASGSGTDVHDVSFSADGCLLAAGGQGLTVRIFHLEDGEIYRDLPLGEGTMTLDFSSDGQLLAVSCEGVVSLRNVASGRRLRWLRHDGSVLPVAFSPDGRFIACGVYGGEISIWGLPEETR